MRLNEYPYTRDGGFLTALGWRQAKNVPAQWPMPPAERYRVALSTTRSNLPPYDRLVTLYLHDGLIAVMRQETAIRYAVQAKPVTIYHDLMQREFIAALEDRARHVLVESAWRCYTDLEICYGTESALADSAYNAYKALCYTWPTFD